MISMAIRWIVSTVIENAMSKWIKKKLKEKGLMK